ncbi:MAG: ligase-associated DNA damage response DEXH box helicase [Alphaproteobacteria bacterium]
MDDLTHSPDASELLTPEILGWFRHQGWQPHPHQLEMLDAARAGQHSLLIAPTGGGKTLAGFLPSLVDLSSAPRPGLHTLYISPLKALSVDVHRNLELPIAGLRLPVRAETRTGDTSQAERTRQRKDPPHLLMTTPESLALMLSYKDAGKLFKGLRTVIIDEIHALASTKRGDLLSLGLARLQKLAPQARRVGLSATIRDERGLMDWLSPSAGTDPDDVRLVRGAASIPPDLSILTTDGEDMPWAGHMALYASEAIYAQIRDARTSIIFVNTRAQAELVFQDLWRLNEDGLAIALHHGSLAREQRQKVEQAMAKGALQAVVATSSLDLGIDWGDVDLVLQVGAPKGSARLLQRTGRANHRLDAPSKAVLVPANRFELFECRAAIEAAMEGDLDGDPPLPGGLDVLCQHLWGLACGGPFTSDDAYREVTSAQPYKDLSRADFDDALEFVATGGHALKVYDRFRRIALNDKNQWVLTHQSHARQYRMNVGTIIDSVQLKVQLGRGRGSVLGTIEEWFVQGLAPGDTFIFAGRLLEYVGMKGMAVQVKASSGGEKPQVPAYEGGRMPLSTHLAARVRQMLADPSCWGKLPVPVADWLRLQSERSVLPDTDGLLVESFPRGGRFYTVAYTFEGRNAHQTLGMLLTRRMERLKLGPLGFVASDYCIAVWSLTRPTDMDALFAEDILGEELEEWMAECTVLKRSFRNCAIIAGLIEQRHPGMEKSGRQITVSSDLIYNVLRDYQPDHILMRATWNDAARGFTDIGRLSDMLSRIKGKITHKALDRTSPLAVPAMLEAGKESVTGHAIDDLLDELSEELIAEAMQ